MLHVHQKSQVKRGLMLRLVMQASLWHVLKQTGTCTLFQSLGTYRNERVECSVVEEDFRGSGRRARLL
eukprot:9115-Eustigmatos_ZCMA.PRE.1